MGNCCSEDNALNTEHHTTGSQANTGLLANEAAAATSIYAAVTTTGTLSERVVHEINACRTNPSAFADRLEKTKQFYQGKNVVAAKDSTNEPTDSSHVCRPDSIMSRSQ